MTRRIVLAAVLGGLTLFAWGALSHLVLKLGDAGLAPVRNEDQALLDAVQATTPQPGIYLYPRMAEGSDGDPAAMEAWAERTKTEPHGLIVVNHHAYAGMGRMFVQEIAIGVLMALVAALVLARAAAGTYLGRVGLVTALGVIDGFRPLQQWNWFEFPAGYTLAQVADGVLAFFALGLVLAAIVRPAKAT